MHSEYLTHLRHPFRHLSDFSRTTSMCSPLPHLPEQFDKAELGYVTNGRNSWGFLLKPLHLAELLATNLALSDKARTCHAVSIRLSTASAKSLCWSSNSPTSLSTGTSSTVSSCDTSKHWTLEETNSSTEEMAWFGVLGWRKNTCLFRFVSSSPWINCPTTIVSLASQGKSP